MTSSTTFEKTQHIACILGNWTDFGVVQDIIEQAGGPGFILDKEYSELEPDDRMLLSFNVCMDLIEPSMTENDWNAIENHSAVAYVFSPYLESSTAKHISGKMLKLVSALLQNGGTAAKSENAGIAHGAERWKQLSEAYEREDDDRVKSRILYEAWVRRPIADSENDQLYSVGMHLLGKPDIQVDACAELRSVSIIDSMAEQLLASDQLPFNSGDVIGDRIARLVPCRYEVDSLNFNPNGCVFLEKADVELCIEERIQRHKEFSQVRISQFNVLFGIQPMAVISYDELPTREAAPPVDVLLYAKQADDGSLIHILVTNGMSDEALTDPRIHGVRSRIELIQYFYSFEEGHAQHLQELACLPHFDGFIVKPLDTIQWPYPAIEDSPWTNALFLPAPLPEHEEFEWELDDESCSLLWLVPISDEELEYKKQNDMDALLDLMDKANLPYVFDEAERKSLLANSPASFASSVRSQAANLSINFSAEPVAIANQRPALTAVAERQHELKANNATKDSSGSEAVATNAKVIFVPTDLSITRNLYLNSDDMRWATWRKMPPLAKPEPEPFDREQCMKRLSEIPFSYGYNVANWELDWSAVVPAAMTRDEALFWYTALTQYIPIKYLTRQAIAHELTERMENSSLSAKSPTLDAVRDALVECRDTVSPHVMQPLSHLFSLAELIDLICGDFPLSFDNEMELIFWRSLIKTNLLEGLRKFVLLYVPESDVNALRAQLKPQYTPLLEDQSFVGMWPEKYYLAAYIGMHDEALQLISEIPDGTYSEDDPHARTDRTEDIVFGLRDAQTVSAHFRRLQLHLTTHDHFRAWLAHTEFSDLDFISDSIKRIARRDECRDRLQLFSKLVDAPEAAPSMLELQLSSKAPEVAREWLNSHIPNAIAGLIPITTSGGEIGNAAIEYLREAKRKGYGEFISQCMNDCSGEVAQKIRDEVL
ncbi:MAG: suppressor of fused domain protein [Cyanobacteria bacterium]|nr:suppressor of fused domain protein [Cyanobacteriota bacterium]